MKMITPISSEAGPFLQTSTSYIQAGDYYVGGPELKRPVCVRVEKPMGETEYWSAIHEQTGIYGTGDTCKEALDDFRSACCQYRDVLAGRLVAGPALVIANWLSENMRSA